MIKGGRKEERREGGREGWPSRQEGLTVCRRAGEDEEKEEAGEEGK